MFGSPAHHRIKKRSIASTIALVATLLFIALAISTVVAVLYVELTTSRFQARYLSELGKKLTFHLEEGPSPAIVFPRYGIYDTRLGYTRLPAYFQALTNNGLTITAQARFSPELLTVSRRGIFTPYHEKVDAGLTILDTNDTEIYAVTFPERVYPDYEAIPTVLVDSLLFIENRELMNLSHPTRNPAIEWDRLTKAVLDKIIQLFRPNHNVPGGSTLATQIEKYRHSPEGMTRTPLDKLQQMASASVRIYLDGEDTTIARRRIVYNYLNSVPLSAAGGLGEVNGIGDGMWAWYGVDFDAFNAALRADENGPGLQDKGRMFKLALSLMVAQRRPSGFLLEGPDRLNEQTDFLLRLLAQERIISDSLRDAALHVKLRFDTKRTRPESGTFVNRKASSMVRVQLGEMLGMPSFYDLDRLDLTVSTTLDREAQRTVTEFLLQLKDPLFLEQNGLKADRLLAKGDPAKVIYSLNLYELGPTGAMPRVQADNLDQPFDINVGTKLDLGSTAKLRTLVTYLEIMARLHDQYAGLDDKTLRETEVSANDRLARWAVDYLLTASDRGLAAMLDAALERQYSASPKEVFYTGGGNHTFSNFSNKDDDSIMSVRMAMRHSVNLVFIRMMRDIVRHYVLQVPGSTARVLEDMNNPLRRQYLERFADQESRVFMKRFYDKYKGKNREQIIDTLISGIRPLPRRLAGAHRYLVPEATLDEFTAFMETHLPTFRESGGKTLKKYYEQFGPDKFSLADQGYITQIHPLELWLARYLTLHPEAGWTDLVTASQKDRLEVYNWLMRSSRKNAQDRRIRSLLEMEAFLEIHKDWKRLGYPFNSLVPSYATSIGSSADRPAALAELMAILVNDGVRPAAALINTLHFAEKTPYETVLTRLPSQGERVMPVEVARAVRGVLRDVVQHGTAGRLNQALVLTDGNEIPIGGKTGTGDHRYVTYKAGGVKSAKVVNRSATFVFYIGDRFYGTITAFVPGADAAGFNFTSALPVTILRLMLPHLQPLLLGELTAMEAAGLAPAPDAVDAATIADTEPMVEGIEEEEIAVEEAGETIAAEPAAATPPPAEPSPAAVPARLIEAGQNKKMVAPVRQTAAPQREIEPGSRRKQKVNR
ncbi:MAG: transglycosylase domain-containing protein [Thermodesulfobacteriota bacterium]